MKTFLFFICFFTAGVLSAQENEALPVDTAVAYFENRLSLLPQEKVYLQTDKPYYLSGEMVWFRAHLVDACYHLPGKLSRYVYVELINPLDSIITRLKVRPNEGAHYGNILLPEDLPEGNYTLRAYTNYMRNQGEDYFFTKALRVGTPQSASVSAETTYEFEDKTVWAIIRFMEIKQHIPFVPKEITLTLNKQRPKRVKPNEEGEFRVKLNLPVDTGLRVMYVEMKYDQYLYRRYFQVPASTASYDIAFFPEGGQLLEGIAGKVAFKAIRPDGWHETVQGEIFDNLDQSVALFKSRHSGMGSFYLYPDPGKTYHAVCENEEGVRKRFELPLPQKNKYGLELSWKDSLAWINLKTNVEEDLRGSLYLLVHSRGRLINVKTCTYPYKQYFFNKRDFPTGVIHFVLLNSTWKPLSERLAFVNNEDQPRIQFQTEQPDYAKRELIRSEFHTGDSLQGSFAVSVTDDAEVEPDSTTTILTSLLLTSDLRGDVESPSYYFQCKDRKVQSDLDLLMMTQGWRRYNMDSVFRKELEAPTYLIEMAQEVSGTVKSGLFSKLADKAKITMMSFPSKLYDMAETDENGRFCFSGFEFPDSTQYIVQALSQKNKKRMIELILDPETFPPLSDFRFPIFKEPDPVSFQQYMDKADQKYTYENGVRMIYLDEVSVSASRKTKYESSYYSEGSFARIVKEEEIEKFHAMDLLDLFNLIPGVFVVREDGRKVPYHRNNPVRLFLINDIPVSEPEFLDIFNPDDVGQLALIYGAATTIFGGRAGNGSVIAIQTKRGWESKPRPQLNKALIAPLGYHEPAEFYSPKYEPGAEPEKPDPDLRSTLYWNPNVTLSENGKGLFEFYAADASTTYSVTIEGVSPDGKIIHYTGKILRNK